MCEISELTVDVVHATYVKPRDVDGDDDDDHGGGDDDDGDDYDDCGCDDDAGDSDHVVR